ncbi:MAG: TetR/AcrR family transcriptional regulator, ethionamide resistance regulator, partial [Subtercola sp.]|nr:TetR/AcrR family transcriptional regulator, ethionamide resistance regulator [Subtercola sp.]
PEVDALWSGAMQTWVGYTTDVIVAERARGAAPGGTDARALAIALNLLNERVLSAAFNAETPALAPVDALDVLTGIWVRSIYR